MCRCFNCKKGLDKLELFVCKICNNDEIVCYECGNQMHKQSGLHVFDNRKDLINIRNMLRDFDPQNKNVECMII